MQIKWLIQIKYQLGVKIIVDISQFLKIKKHIEYLSKMLGDKNCRGLIQEMKDAAVEAYKGLKYIEENREDRERER